MHCLEYKVLEHQLIRRFADEQEKLLVVDPTSRLSAQQALLHPWLQTTLGPHPAIAPLQKLSNCQSHIFPCKEVC